ncbi:MAG: hypothetical protein ACLUKN_16665 [Bacilli bacterium]
MNETKLDVMAAVLFDNIIENKEDVIEEAVKTLNETLKEIRTESKRDFSGYQMRIEKAEKKLDTLLAMRADGEISKEEYVRARRDAIRRSGTENAMLASAQDHPKEESIDMDYVRDLLGRLTVNENGKADKDVLTEFIDTVTVEKDNIFLWGLWLRNKPTYFRMTTEGRGKKMTARCEEGKKSSKSNDPPPKWGKNGRLLSAGCSRDRQISVIQGAKN